jgi:hypothetical protein
MSNSYLSGNGNSNNYLGGYNNPFGNASPYNPANQPAAPSSGTDSSSSSSAPAQQSPSIFGTGQYYAPNYAGFNPSALSGAPSQSDGNYGLNDVWSNLSSFVGANAAPQNYAVQAPMATAAQGQAAYGQAAQGQASSYSAALARAAQAQAAQAQGATMGAATAGPAAMTGAPQISTAGDASQLAVQQNLENTLQTQANGGGTSAADLQLQQGEQQQVANQMAMLGSQRGGAMNAGLAQTQAANQTAQAQAQLNAQMGIQRAQETQAAQQALGTVAGTARGQSQSYNTAQAGLSSTANLANQSAANQMAQFNTSDEQAANAANAQLAQGNSQFNATNLQNTSLANAQLAQAATLANQGATNTASATNAGNSQAMTLANLLAQNNMTSQNVGNAQAMSLANLGNAQQTNLSNLSAASQYGLANQTAAENAYNTASQNTLAGLGAQTGVGEANRSAELASEQLGVQQQLGNNQIDSQNFQAAAQQNANLAGAVASFLGTGVAGGINAFKSNSGSGSGSSSNPGGSSPSSTGGSSTPTGGSDGGEGNAYTGDQSYSGDDGSGDVSLSQTTSASNIGFPVTTSGRPPVSGQLSYSDENIKEGIEGGNPMMRSFLSQLAQSKRDQTIDPNADMGFRLAGYGKQYSSSGPSDGGIGAKVGGAAGTAGGAAAGAAIGAAAGSVVPGIGTAIGAIGGLLGGLFGSSVGGAADGSGSTSSRNVMTSPGTGETATDGTITDLDDENTVATSDDEAKENVISGNRGMQAFLQQAGAQQGANAARGSTSNAFMQTGQAPSSATDRQMPAPPPYAQGYGQSNGGGVYAGGPGNAGGFSGGGTMGSGGAAQGGIFGKMAPFAGGVTSPGGVSNPGGMQSFGFAGGTPMPARATPVNATNPANPIVATPTPLQSAENLAGVASQWAAEQAPQAPPTYPVSQSYPAVPPYLPNGQAATQATGTPLMAIGSPMMRTLSDENSKADVHNLSADNMRDFLDALHAHQYRYKEPDLPGAGHGTFVSPMAQEIESTPLGRPAVSTNPQTGYKQVDYSKLAGTQLAGLAYLNERQNKLEELLRSTGGMVP